MPCHATRLKVLTKETIRVGRFLGQVDIFLHSLKDEQERCGWFPLRPQRSSLNATIGKDDNVSGSVKLRLRWINTQAGFRYYVRESLDARKEQLAQLMRNMKKLYSACNRRDEGQRGNRMRALVASPGHDAVPMEGRRRRGRSASVVIREGLTELCDAPLSPNPSQREDASDGAPEATTSTSGLILRVPSDAESMDDVVADLYRRQRKVVVSVSTAEPSPHLPSLTTSVWELFPAHEEGGDAGGDGGGGKAGAEGLGTHSPPSRRSSCGSDSVNALSAAEVLLGLKTDGPDADADADTDAAARHPLDGETEEVPPAAPMVAASDRSERERAGGMLASIGRRVSSLVLGTPAPFTPSVPVPPAPPSPSLVNGQRASDVPAPAPMLAMIPRGPSSRSAMSSSSALSTVLRLPGRKTKHPAHMWTWADAAQRCTAAQAAAGPRISAMAPRPRPQNDFFMRRFEEEGNCALAHVIATSGRIEVTPIEAHNVRVLDARSQLFVQVSYGDKAYRTKKVGVGPSVDASMLGGTFQPHPCIVTYCAGPAGGGALLGAHARHVDGHRRHARDRRQRRRHHLGGQGRRGQSVRHQHHRHPRPVGRQNHGVAALWQTRGGPR